MAPVCAVVVWKRAKSCLEASLQKGTRLMANAPIGCAPFQKRLSGVKFRNIQIFCNHLCRIVMLRLMAFGTGLSPDESAAVP